MLTTHFKLTGFHYNKSIHLSPLPATKLNEIHKKKKMLMKIDNYDYYSKIFILCLYMEYILVLDINYECVLFME
jgi:hypothetical protein